MRIFAYVCFRPWIPQYSLWHKTFNSRQNRLNDIYDTPKSSLAILEKKQSNPQNSAIIYHTTPHHTTPHHPTPHHTTPHHLHHGCRITRIRSPRHRSPTRPPSHTRKRNLLPQDTAYQKSIVLASPGTRTGFRALMTLLPPDLGLTEKAMVFPRYHLQTPDSTQGGIFEGDQPATSQTEVEPTESTKSPQPPQRNSRPQLPRRHRRLRRPRLCRQHPRHLAREVPNPLQRHLHHQRRHLLLCLRQSSTTRATGRNTRTT